MRAPLLPFGKCDQVVFHFGQLDVVQIIRNRAGPLQGASLRQDLLGALLLASFAKQLPKQLQRSGVLRGEARRTEQCLLRTKPVTDGPPRLGTDQQVLWLGD